MMNSLLHGVLEPKPHHQETNELCPVCGYNYDYVDVISTYEYTTDLEHKPVCTRVSNDLIEIYYHESMVGGDSWL